MSIHSLAYGRSMLQLHMAEHARVLHCAEPPTRVSVEQFVNELRACLDTAARDLRRIAVVVADKTRLCDYPLFLPGLHQVLLDAGASAQAISYFIAYGTHAPQSPQESRAAYGPLFDQARFVHHDCADSSLFVNLGTTDAGTPVMVRKEIADATLLITFGALSHHYFAGYGGGRKLIMPGLGFKQSIYHNHGLFLDKSSGRLHPGCQAGALAGNPLAEDLAHCERLRPADIAIHGILNSHGRVCSLVMGPAQASFLEAVAQQSRFYELSESTLFDTVVASCGGYPKDINLIQAHKTIHNAAAWVRDGGRLIVLACCEDGIGSATLLPWFGYASFDVAFKELSARYEGNGGTALALMQKAARINITLVSSLEASVCATIGVQRLEPEELAGALKRQRGSLAVIPNGSLLVKRAPPVLVAGG